jgi:hypothetical protein
LICPMFSGVELVGFVMPRLLLVKDLILDRGSIPIDL